MGSPGFYAQIIELLEKWDDGTGFPKCEASLNTI